MTLDAWLRVALLPAPLLVVHLALRHVPADVPFGRLARRLLPFAGACAALGLALPVGPWSASACVPWLIASACIALAGAFRLAQRATPSPEELCIDVGFVYLPVGAAWLFASRAGMIVLGFSEPFVLLTAVHFHYAGFAALVLTGLTGRALRDPRGRVPRGYAHLVAVVAVAPVLTALGITLSLLLERVAAVCFALALGGVAVALLWRVAPTAPPRARPWLFLAGLAPLVSMALALVYALRGLLPFGLSIPAMAAVHGALNVVGFVLCGFQGYRVYVRERSLL